MPALGQSLRLPKARFVSSGASFALDGMATDLEYAYSPSRRLLTAYEGNALLVRRASDDDQLAIGFGADGLLDLTALQTFCEGTDGHVVTLYDQREQFDLTQATAAQQPLIVSSGVVQTGSAGQPIMVFDGSDDVLGSALPGSLPAYSLLSLARCGAAGSYNNLASLKSFVLELRRFDSNDYAQFLVESGGVGLVNVPSVAIVDTWRTYCAQQNTATTTANLHVGGTSGTPTNMAETPADSLFLGARNGAGALSWSGSIGELFLYSRYLNDADRGALEAIIQ